MWYTEKRVSFKNVYKLAKHSFATTSLSQKDITWNGNTVTAVKKEFRAQRSVKKVMLTVFLNVKGFITKDFLDKGATVDDAPDSQLLWHNSPIFTE